jgi:hypothetical protein
LVVEVQDMTNMTVMAALPLGQLVLALPRQCREPRVADRSVGQIMAQETALEDSQVIMVPVTRREHRMPHLLDLVCNHMRCTTHQVSPAFDIVILQAVKNPTYWKRLGWESRLQALERQELPILIDSRQSVHHTLLYQEANLREALDLYPTVRDIPAQVHHRQANHTLLIINQATIPSLRNHNRNN